MHPQTKLSQLAELISRYAQTSGSHPSALHNLSFFRESVPSGRQFVMYEATLIIAAQGRKMLYFDGKHIEYGAGKLLALFMPMPVDCEIIEASKEQPLLVAAIRLDRHRLAKMLLKFDKINSSQALPHSLDASGVFSATLSDALLDAVIRLIQTLDNAADTAILGEAIVDEIYYRMLSHDQAGSLRVMLRQQGQIQQISRAVEYLNEHLEENVSVDELANLVNMSNSGFHRKFKEVMHLSPLQYSKLLRLNTARTYLVAGKNVSEAGYLVGYNSPAQFSREYKRQFGEAPSETVIQG